MQYRISDFLINGTSGLEFSIYLMTKEWREIHIRSKVLSEMPEMYDLRFIKPFDAHCYLGIINIRNTFYNISIIMIGLQQSTLI